MIKLLIIYHSGLAEVIKNIFREYVKKGIDLTVIVPLKNGPLVYSPKHDEKGFKYIPLKLRAGYNFFKLFSAIKKTKPDVIHVFDEYHNFSLFQTILCRNILYGKRVPVVCLSFQNIPYFYKSLPPTFESPVKFLRRFILKIFQPFIISFHNRYLDGVVAGNSEVISNIRNIGGKMPIEKIFWGVNFNKFYKKDRVDCREKLGIPKDIKLIGYVGKVMKAKGVDLAVKAVGDIKGYHLAFVGIGDFEKDLKELKELIGSLKMNDRVHFYDKVKSDDLVDYYNSFDLLVVPSKTTANWKEQYGRVLVEGMACHLPVVGSSSGSIPEVLEGYPKHLIFKESDYKDLKEKILQAEKMNFPENFDINNFMKKYSLENFVNKSINFYKKISNGKL